MDVARAEYDALGEQVLSVLPALVAVLGELRPQIDAEVEHQHPRQSRDVVHADRSCEAWQESRARDRADPQEGSIPDTIFLLTGGVPTIHPDNKLDSTDKFIKAVREWNALKAVVVHTIGLGTHHSRASSQRRTGASSGSTSRPRIRLGMGFVLQSGSPVLHVPFQQ